MKFALVGRNGEEYEKVVQQIKFAGLNLAEKDPDIVFSYGGDGTFLVAEYKYPGVPKLLIKNSKICKKCVPMNLEDALFLLKQEKHELEEQMKLKATVRGQILQGVNDIVVRNKLPTHAIRFKLSVGGDEWEEELIGDGIVIATPFGSDAYYYSISKKGFNNGIGIAFNNLTTDMEHLNIPEEQEIEIELTRGEAYVVADNNPDAITVKEGDKIKIKKSEHTARLVTFKKG